MKKRLKPIPTFASEADERRFWQTHDSAEYVDWSGAQSVVLPNLKATINFTFQRKANGHETSN